jgi:hypothetical protein
VLQRIAPKEKPEKKPEEKPEKKLEKKPGRLDESGVHHSDRRPVRDPRG